MLGNNHIKRCHIYLRSFPQIFVFRYLVTAYFYKKIKNLTKKLIIISFFLKVYIRENRNKRPYQI